MSFLWPALLFSMAYAQSAEDCPDYANFVQCRQTVADYQTLTCNPLNEKNANWFSICSCYQAINDKNCFDRCPGSQPAQQLLTSTIIPNRDALCNPLNINPLAPPPSKQPWETFVPVTSAKPAPVSSPVLSGTAPAQTSAKSDAFSLETNSIFSGFFALLLAML